MTEPRPVLNFGKLKEPSVVFDKENDLEITISWDVASVPGLDKLDFYLDMVYVETSTAYSKFVLQQPPNELQLASHQHNPKPTHSVSIVSAPGGGFSFIPINKSDNVSLRREFPSKTLQLTCSALTHGKAIVVRAIATDPRWGSQPLAVSEPFYVVPVAHLVVQTELPDGIFFKDRGGKDSGITLKIHIADDYGQPFTGADVQLRPQLLYEDGSRVQDQTILKSINSLESFTTRQGQACLKFRINEVSSKHRGQRFVIRLHAECKATGAERVVKITEGQSDGIEVRSKVNKRKPTSTADSEENSLDGEDGVVMKRQRLLPAEPLLPTQQQVDPFFSTVGSSSSSAVSPEMLSHLSAAINSVRDVQSEVEKLEMLVKYNNHSTRWTEDLNKVTETLTDKMRTLNHEKRQLEILFTILSNTTSSLPLLPLSTAVVPRSLPPHTAALPLISSEEEAAANLIRFQSGR